MERSFAIALDEVFLILNVLDNSIRTIIHANDLILRNVVDASRGKVTSSLMPVKDLLHILTLAEKRHKLIPVSTGADVLHYYPLLSAMLTSDATVVPVPFLSQNVYNIHRIEAFSFAVNDYLLTIDLPDFIVLTNEGLTLYSIGTYEDLSECKSEQAGLSFCPASLFALYQLKRAVFVRSH